MPDLNTLPPSFLDLYEALDAGYLSVRRDREATSAVLNELEADAALQARKLALGQG